MFDNLFAYAKELNSEMTSIYWTMLPVVVLILIVLEMLKSADQQPNVGDILRRMVISMVLLLSFSTVVNAIGVVGDGITARIDQTQNLWSAIKQFGPNSQGESGSLFNLRENIVYFFSIAAYLIAYIGFFASVALMNFVWAILYACAPLMLLCYVPRSTAGITQNLYKGLVSVATWKILWVLLGALLLKIAMNPKVAGTEDYILAIVMNLLIGLSMLLIPLFTKSLLSDGLHGAATALAAAPGLMTARSAMMAGKHLGRKTKDSATGFASFAAKPVTNPISGRARVMANRLNPKMKKFKNWYSKVGLPKEAKKIIQNERKRKFAFRPRK